MADAEDGNPLRKLERDPEEFNRQRLADAIDGLVYIDQESGDALLGDDFDELDTRRQIVALLLARRAAVDLGHVSDDSVGVFEDYLQPYLGAAKSTIRRYTTSKLGFVELDREKGGFYIPKPQIPNAIDFLERAKDW